MYTNLYVYTAYRQYMSGPQRLYWRYKKNGKWTWRPALVLTSHLNDDEDGTPAYYSYEVRGEEE